MNVRSEVEAAVELFLDELIWAHVRANGIVVGEIRVVLELVSRLRGGEKEGDPWFRRRIRDFEGALRS